MVHPHPVHSVELRLRWNTLSIGGTEIGKVVGSNLTDLDQVNTTSSPTARNHLNGEHTNIR